MLGSLLIAPRHFDEAVELLEPDDFFDRRHQLIYAGMIDLSETADDSLDAVALAEWLNSNGNLDTVGGMHYLAELVSDVPSAANVIAYARVVRTLSMQRRLIDVGQRIASIGFAPEGRDDGQMLQDADEALAGVGERRLMPGPEPLDPVMARVLEELEGALKDDKPRGLHTGFDTVDKKIVALRPADLVVVAGRPSMGKTAFAMNIVEHNLLQRPAEHTQPIVVFSLEMPAGDLAMRMLASVGKVDGERIRAMRCNDLDWKKMARAVKQLKNKPLLIDSSATLSPTEIRHRLRRVAREHGPPALVVVDYIQLMHAPGAENRTNEISEISRSLKAIAKQFHCPLIAISQLNRAVEGRPNKRPIMADLRESGAIEQDADIVLFVYRDVVYNENSDERDAEIIISKQRNGPTGRCKLAFTKQHMSFSMHDHKYDSYPDAEPAPPWGARGGNGPAGPTPFEN